MDCMQGCVLFPPEKKRIGALFFVICWVDVWLMAQYVVLLWVWATSGSGFSCFVCIMSNIL